MSVLRSRSIATFTLIPHDGNELIDLWASQPDHATALKNLRACLAIAAITGCTSWQPLGHLYFGFSGNLHTRVFQRKFHHFEGFTEKYNLKPLLYRESYDHLHKGLVRETQLKGRSRTKKVV